MPQQQNPELTAADIRKLLNEKFPPTNPREKVYVSVTLALLDNQEVVEAQVKGLAELFGLLCMALEIDPRQLLALKNKKATGGEENDEVLGGGSSGTAGMGGSGVGGGASAGGAGGGGAGPANPIKDSTPFPAGVPTSAPPGTKPAPKVTSQAKPAPVVEDTTPNVQSGPAVNARPNVTPPPVNGAPKAS